MRSKDSHWSLRGFWGQVWNITNIWWSLSQVFYTLFINAFQAKDLLQYGRNLPKKTFPTLNTNLQTLKPLYACTAILSLSGFYPRDLYVRTQLSVFYPGLILLAPNSWWASGDVGWCWNTVTDQGYGEAFSYAPMRPQYGCFTRAPPPRSNHLDSLQVLWTRRVRDECCVCEQTDVEKLLMWFFGNPLERMCESGLWYWLNFLKTIYYF